MLRLKKILLVASLLVTGVIGASTIGATPAQAHGYGGFYGGYNYYVPTYRVYNYYTPIYNHCAPSYGYGYGLGY